MRDITQLHPRLQAKIDELKYLCNKKGYNISITECVRTVKEQDALYAQGRTKPGNIVTNAKGSSYSSMHQWGVAFDFCRNDGKGAFNDSDSFFTKVGKIGKAIGLEWGGSWTSIKDKPHFQLSSWGSTATKLKSKYGTPSKFKKIWTDYSGTYTTKISINLRVLPGTEYDVLTKIPKGTPIKADGVWDKSKTGFVWLRVTYNGKTGYVSKKNLK